MNSTLALDDYLATNGCVWGDDICDVYVPATDEEFLRQYADALNCGETLPQCDPISSRPVPRFRLGHRDSDEGDTDPTYVAFHIAVYVVLTGFIVSCVVSCCRKRFQCGRLYQ